MAAGPGSVPQTFKLTPPGPRALPNTIHPLAQAGGRLVGAVVGGTVRTWLAGPDGHLVLMMWPEGFTARFNPLEVLDRAGQIVARGGELVVVGGGFLKRGDPRGLGHAEVFVCNPIVVHGDGGGIRRF